MARIPEDQVESGIHLTPLVHDGGLFDSVRMLFSESPIPRSNHPYSFHFLALSSQVVNASGVRGDDGPLFRNNRSLRQLPKKRLEGLR